MGRSRPWRRGLANLSRFITRIVAPLFHGALHGEELIFKFRASFAKGHVQAQLGCLFEAERAILHRNHHVGDFFAGAAERVIHSLFFRRALAVDQTN